MENIKERLTQYVSNVVDAFGILLNALCGGNCETPIWTTVIEWFRNR